MAQVGELLTTSEVAAYFRVTTETIRRWANTDLIPSIKMPSGRRKFVRADIEAKASELGLIDQASA